MNGLVVIALKEVLMLLLCNCYVNGYSCLSKSLVLPNAIIAASTTMEETKTFMEDKEHPKLQETDFHTTKTQVKPYFSSKARA